MKIEQCIISNNVSFFEKQLRERYNFINYKDTNKPVFFFGFRGLNDIFEKHNSYKIILPATSDDLPNFRNLKNVEKTILIVETELPFDYFLPDSVLVKKLILEIKDYSLFSPNLLGDKIYYYSGFSNGWSPNPKHLIDEIQKEIEYEIITTNHSHLKCYHDTAYLKINFYDKCFVNLNLSNGHGMTTTRELAMMGRKTIVINNPYNYSCLLRCKNKESIISTIIEESKKINTIQPQINVHTIGDEWLDLEYLIKI